jgi:Ca2+/Na+ antiporter
MLKISAWWVTNFQIIETVVGFPRDLAVVFVVVMTFSFSFFFCKLLLLLLLLFFFVLVVLVVLVVFASAFTTLDDDVFLFPIVKEKSRVFAHAHKAHKRWLYFFRAERESGESVFLVVLKRKESFPRKLLRMYIYDMRGQKKDI